MSQYKIQICCGSYVVVSKVVRDVFRSDYVTTKCDRATASQRLKQQIDLAQTLILVHIRTCLGGLDGLPLILHNILYLDNVNIQSSWNIFTTKIQFYVCVWKIETRKFC